MTSPISGALYNSTETRSGRPGRMGLNAYCEDVHQQFDTNAVDKVGRSYLLPKKFDPMLYGPNTTWKSIVYLGRSLCLGTIENKQCFHNPVYAYLPAALSTLYTAERQHHQEK